jgi:predicted ATPase
LRPGELTLKGWKGFDVEVPLWPVTFLVGPNGSGKSSLLEALALISHLARRGTLREDLRSWLRGWPDGVFTRTGDGTIAQEARISMRWAKATYEVVLKCPRQPTIWAESLRVGGKSFIRTVERGDKRFRSFTGEGAGRGLSTDKGEESALGLIAKSPKRRKRAQRFIDLITAIEMYSLDADFLRGTAVDTRPIPYARKGTSLVSGFIDAQRDAKVWKALMAALRAVQPDLMDVEPTERPRGVILKYLDGRQTQLDEESDGLVRAAGMFLVRYRENCPAILGFDEPENGFHLSRLVDVASRLAPSSDPDLPSPSLVLLATHSPDFVYRAARTLGARMGVLTFWRSREGKIAVTQWPGEEIAVQANFDLLRAEGFEGR